MFQNQAFFLFLNVCKTEKLMTGKAKT